MSAVLLISLVGRVLTDVPLPALLAQILALGLGGRVSLGSLIFAWPFGAAVLLRHGRQFGHRVRSGLLLGNARKEPPFRIRPCVMTAAKPAASSMPSLGAL